MITKYQAPLFSVLIFRFSTRCNMAGFELVAAGVGDCSDWEPLRRMGLSRARVPFRRTPCCPPICRDGVESWRERVRTELLVAEGAKE
jgi:hypothetical protein